MIAMMVMMTLAGGDYGDADDGGNDFGYCDDYNCDNYHTQFIYPSIHLIVFVYLFI